MRKVKLFRVRMGESGQLPKGYPEGMIVGLTQLEFESLQKSNLLKICFEEIELISEYNSQEPKND